MPSTDEALESMASELYHALLAAGADPSDPPDHTRPPSVAAFSEYRRRGGDQFDDSDAFTAALIERVQEAAKQ